MCCLQFYAIGNFMLLLIKGPIAWNKTQWVSWWYSTMSWGMLKTLGSETPQLDGEGHRGLLTDGLLRISLTWCFSSSPAPAGVEPSGLSQQSNQLSAGWHPASWFLWSEAHIFPEKLFGSSFGYPVWLPQVRIFLFSSDPRKRSLG